MTAPETAPVALVTGGSSGLGKVLAERFLRQRYRVMIVGRDSQRLHQACEDLAGRFGENTVAGVVADLTLRDEAAKLVGDVEDRFGRLDVLVNAVGISDRGLVEQLSPERLDEMVLQNVTTALLCSQAALPMLEAASGVIVNIGSLASKVGARYIGGYALAKHALAGMTQQMRLELRPRGVHVALVSPGPIRRADAGSRYDQRLDESLPAQAASPGGGTRLKGLDPQRVADSVWTCVRRRKPDVILPGRMRWLIALGHAFPRLGDWLLLKFTSSKQ
ncbi:MAG: SDR family oxidoreductase [Pirellulales bacterium]|nr:SDR family oxidoreductase [Pirellulales bacterium]